MKKYLEKILKNFKDLIKKLIGDFLKNYEEFLNVFVKMKAFSRIYKRF